MSGLEKMLFEVGKQLADLAFSYIDVIELKELISNVLKTKEVKKLISYFTKMVLRIFAGHPEPIIETEIKNEHQEKEGN
jgi:hypothetical protein